VALEVRHVQTAHGAKARQVETDDRGDVLRVSAVCVEVIGSGVDRNAAVPVGAVDAKVLVVHDRSMPQGWCPATPVRRSGAIRFALRVDEVLRGEAG